MDIQQLAFDCAVQTSSLTVAQQIVKKWRGLHLSSQQGVDFAREFLIAVDLIAAENDD